MDKNIKPVLTTTQWLLLPLAVRGHFIAVFNIKRSSGSQVLDDKVISDGHTHDDLSVVTVESMQKYLGSDEVDFFNLLNKVIAKTPIEKVSAPTEAGSTPIDIKITLDTNGLATATIITPKKETNEKINKESVTTKEPRKASTKDKGTVNKGTRTKKGN